MPKTEGSSKRDKAQEKTEHREVFQRKMVEVGFVPGTQTAYPRAYDRFEEKLDRKTTGEQRRGMHADI